LHNTDKRQLFMEKGTTIMHTASLSYLLATVLAGSFVGAGPVPLQTRLQKSLGYRYMKAKKSARHGQTSHAIRMFASLANKTKGTVVAHKIQKHLSSLTKTPPTRLRIKVDTAVSYSQGNTQSKSKRRSVFVVSMKEPFHRDFKINTAAGKVALELTLRMNKKHEITLSGWLMTKGQKRPVSIRTASVTDSKKTRHNLQLELHSTKVVLKLVVEHIKGHPTTKTSRRRVVKREQRLSVQLKKVTLKKFLTFFAQMGKLRLKIKKGVPTQQAFSFRFKNLPRKVILEKVCSVAKVDCIQHKGMLIVAVQQKAPKAPKPPVPNAGKTTPVPPTPPTTR
tara:strand:- start:2296 stop:3303 length:1008 start_codon:yes stop_codon:yes gene_type:complete